ncbi:MAG: hypothetical protein AAGJ50_09210 [Pseudomonadota bacterium]
MDNADAGKNGPRGQVFLLPMLFLVSSCATIPDQSIEITDSRFLAIMFNADCDATVTSSGSECADRKITPNAKRIPNIPKRSCYAWFVQFNASSKDQFVIERLIFPAPWLTPPPENTPDVTYKLTRDKKTLVARHLIDAGDGEVRNSWCVNEDTSNGKSAIEVEYQGQLVKRFDFTVEPPDAIENKVHDGMTK